MVRVILAVLFAAVCWTASAGPVEDMIGKTVLIMTTKSSSYIVNVDKAQVKLTKKKLRGNEEHAYKVVKGLAGKGISFESVAHPGHYLREQISRLYVSPTDKTEAFNKQCTFMIEKGLSGGSSAFSMKPLDLADEYVTVGRGKALMTELKPRKSSASFELKEIEIEE